ncbi:fungal-specific transcription factor domain-containing protein [Penicillium hordei]|uniref:Fungal-specific transcription factor domain-containing protein n=1 Tax=Penicillium hordei TaxID=40994 RepID=A0AAD6EIL8_9EURO|nr:fungal-specific transcription factor domain-containing protein [Penicillium hordei]KAJ5617305.1 fungal-specific transcription factor domain-containing protein [Penicillium hordei]
MRRLEQAIFDISENIKPRDETPASLAGSYSHPVLEGSTDTNATGTPGDPTDASSQGQANAIEIEMHGINSMLPFGRKLVAHNLPSICPNPLQRQAIWQSYLENVAPLVTVVHRPSLEKLLAQVNESEDTLEKADKALVFAVYLSAIISMTPAQCFDKLGEQQESAIAWYRLAVEQALTEADLFNSHDFTLLQSAVLYLISIRRHDKGHLVWTMTAVVLRLAQKLEFHRESALSVTSPMDAEMSRRLWWHILVLDVQSAEDHRTEPLIHDGQFDTKFPLNINDEDLVLGDKDFPCERSGYTNMTFSLIRFEITATYRLLKYSSFRQPDISAEDLLASRQQHVIGLERRLREKYLRHSTTSATVHWLCATISWLVLAKLRVSVYDTLMSGDMWNMELNASIREFLFATSIDVIELSAILETSQKNLGNWTWIFKNNNQWRALSFVLVELCLHPMGNDVDRAWRAIDHAFSLWESQDACAQKDIWSIVSQLKERAIQARRRQLVNFRIPASTLARQYCRSFPVVESQHLNDGNDVRQPLSTCTETPSCSPEHSSRMHYSWPAWNPPDLSAFGSVEDPGLVSGINTSAGDLPENLYFSHTGSLSDHVLGFF